MSNEVAYKDGNALWAAVTEHAKSVSKKSGLAVQMLIRQFVMDRFLARVFGQQNNEWTLKGGNAVLTRVYDARATKDVDLLAELNDLDAAVSKLRVAVETDLDDYFRFVIKSVRPAGGSTGQPNVGACKISVEAYCGVKVVARFSVDLVTGSLMTDEPDLQIRRALVPSVLPARVRLYPVVDHIADKLCATQSTYGSLGDRPSSRVRDLVDLVVFARTQCIQGDALNEAISAEWLFRELPGKPHFEPPADWRRPFPPEARRVPACGDIRTFDQAVELVGGLLNPAIDLTAVGKQWSPDLRAWTAA